MKKSVLPIAALALLLVQAARADPPTQAVDRPADLEHEKTLYVVGYAHLDTQWRWSYPQVISEFIANTLHNNFALFQRYPDYVFNFSGSRRYEFMQEYYPAEFETLKKYVAAGKWFPCGSSVDECDSMVPSAESLVRQVLYGNHYFRRQFGVASEEFMLPDCFGFPAGLPSILAHCGIKGFSTQKLTWGSAVGIPFKVGVWVGPDGKSVVAALDPGAYSGKVEEDLSQSDSWLARINHTGEGSGVFVDYHYYGTGDRGGSPVESSVDWIERSVHGTGPVRVISGAADRLVRDLSPEGRERLPRYQGELLLTQHSSGSITSEAYMKRWNRKNELLADAAERASVAAMWLGSAPYPADRLYAGWDLLLGSQMHDMLPGTSLPKAYEYCWNDECLAQNEFNSVLGSGLGAVSEELDTRATGASLVVFNPLSTGREDPIEAWVEFPKGVPSGVRVVDGGGREIPSQVTAREDHRLKVLFLARVPSVGFAVFDVQPSNLSAQGQGTGLSVSTAALENRRYRVTLNAAGDIESVYDKANGREVLSGPHRLAFQFEKPTVFPAWNMDWEDQSKPPRGFVDGPPSVRVVESGPVRVALEVIREAEGSRFVQTIRLGSGDSSDLVEVAARIDWQSRECCLKAVFPMSVSNPLATYDSQLGTVTRGNDDPKKYEVPQHQWFDLTDSTGNYGVSVLNDSKYGSDKPDDRTMRLTLLYTPGVRNSYQDQASQDDGRHEMVYAIYAHNGDWRAGDVPWEAARLNQPLIAFQTSGHEGRLGRSLSLLGVTSRQVIVTAVKEAEDGTGVVVRLRELEGKPATGTRLVFAAPVVSAREVDGQERTLGPATLEQGMLVTDVPAYGLRAFALNLDASPGTAQVPWSQAVALSFDHVASSAPGAPGVGFDEGGRSFPAEAMPPQLDCDGVRFTLGPEAPGQPNAVECRGQKIALPAGDYDRVYVIAASAEGDSTGSFSAGGPAVDLLVPEWTGYIGQWDNRQWSGEVPQLAYVWSNALSGLSPAYLKTAEVAWFSSHRHDSSGATEFYQHSYLFKIGIPRAPGARELALPDNPRIRIFAVSAASGSHDSGRLASDVFEDFKDHELDAPTFLPRAGSYHDTTTVAIHPPLYWREGCIHYTTDGSEPTVASAVYVRPFDLSSRAVVRARYLDRDKTGPVGEAAYEVDDTTPPSVVRAVATSVDAEVRLVFSEPVSQASAEDPSHYSITTGGLPKGPLSVASAALGPDERTVTLRLTAPFGGETQSRVAARAIADRSPAANMLKAQSLAVDVAIPAIDIAGAHCPEDAKEVALPPAKTWTLNFFVRMDDQPPNRTLIAGFGSVDNQVDGTGRYLAKFADGLHFWSRKRELETTTPLEVGRWQMLTESYDGRTLTLYRNGVEIDESAPVLADDQPVLRIAPLDPWDHMRRFKGDLRHITFWTGALPSDFIRLLWDAADENR